MKRPPSEEAVREAVEIFRRHRTMHTEEAKRAGIHYATLYWMRDEGLLERLSRGVYRLAELSGPSKYDILTVAARAPSAVICLISALDFHEIGTQIPSAVSIAMGHKDRTPQIDHPPIRVYRMSGEALTAGVETHEIDGVTVRVYSVAKTIADCFKFRSKIGRDVAIEALQEVLRTGRAKPAQIMEYAQVDRVANIMRSYMEALQ